MTIDVLNKEKFSRIVSDFSGTYNSDKYPLQEETFKTIAACMEVHTLLGKDFAEVVYKDALEHEFKLRDYHFSREALFEIEYKDTILKHFYRSDFIVFDKVLIEIKASKDAN
jgi:GxxExxY protein